METDARNREVQDGTLTVSVRVEPGQSTLILGGELDMANAQTLAAELERVEHEGADQVLIDMSRLEFIDSTGIAVIVAAHRRLNDGAQRLRLVPSTATEVRRVMDVTGLARKLPFLSSDQTG